MALDPTSEWPWPVAEGRRPTSLRHVLTGPSILDPLPNTDTTLIPLSWAPAGLARPFPGVARVPARSTPVVLQPLLTPAQTSWQGHSTHWPSASPACLAPPGTILPPPLAVIATETLLILATQPAVTQPQGLTPMVTQPYGSSTTVTQPTGLSPEVQ